MIIKSGVDLIYLPRFKRSLKKGGENFLRRVYHKSELTNDDSAHLAGIFAAKEAVIKALSLPTDSWHDINVVYQPNGEPQIKTSSAELADQISNSSLSISHDGNYIIAQFVAIAEP